MFNKVLSCAVVGMLFALASTFVLATDGVDSFAKQINAERLNNLSTSNKFAYGVTLSRMPTSVGSPNYSGSFTRSSDAATLTFWRESVDGKERLFVKVAPTTASYFFCPGGSQFSIIQNGRDYGEDFRVTRGDNSSVCESLKTSGIFLVDQWELYTSFVEASAFVISYASSGYTGSISVAAAGTPTPTCYSPQVLQNGQCVTPTPTCYSPQVLENGQCVTPTPTCYSPQVLQNGQCVTLTSTCTSPQVLQNGQCVTLTPTCTSPQILQDGKCVTPTPTTTTSGATYSNGILTIKRLEIDSGALGKAYYDVTMTLKALSNPLTFVVDSAVPSK